MNMHGKRSIYESASYAEAMQKLRTHYTAEQLEAEQKQKQEKPHKLTAQERRGATAGRKAEAEQKRRMRGTAAERRAYEKRKAAEAAEREAMTEYLPMAEDSASYGTGKQAQTRRPKKHYIVTGTDNGMLTDLAGVMLDRRAEHIARQALKTAHTHSGNGTMYKLWTDSFRNNSKATAEYNGMIDAEHTEHTAQERKTHTRKRVNIDGKIIMQECLPYDTMELTEYGKDALTAQVNTSTDFDDLKQTAALAYIEHSAEILHIDDIERQDKKAFAAVNAAIYSAKKDRVNTDEQLADTMTIGAGDEQSADYAERVIYGKTRTAQTMEQLFNTADILDRLEHYILTHAHGNANTQALVDSLRGMATGESVQEQADRTGQAKQNVSRTRAKVQAMLCNAEVRAMLTDARQDA